MGKLSFGGLLDFVGTAETCILLDMEIAVPLLGLAAGLSGIC